MIIIELDAFNFFALWLEAARDTRTKPRKNERIDAKSRKEVEIDDANVVGERISAEQNVNDDKIDLGLENSREEISSVSEESAESYLENQSDVSDLISVEEVEAIGDALAEMDMV